MQIKATTVEDYIHQLPAERQQPMKELRSTILQHLPIGFEETISYGMIGYVVPHSIYPNGYHCTPKLPLPFIAIGSQKNFIVMHHMGLYGDTKLLQWFQNEYAKRVPTKLDMGKGCVRFKKVEHIPFELIGDLASKITPEEWIRVYEANLTRK
ncbi:MAG: DUF1801 domain-containing protein [Ignavibacteria bacterium]|nr:DUF1801 domain-containing protein [Ignavibacteria bacterium]